MSLVFVLRFLLNHLFQDVIAVFLDYPVFNSLPAKRALSVIGVQVCHS